MGTDRGLIARYDRLAELAELEAAAAIAGDLDEFSQLVAQCEQLRATLPAEPPAEARPALERAMAAQLAGNHALKIGVAEARSSLQRLQRSRTSVMAYGGPVAPLVDASS